MIMWDPGTHPQFQRIADIGRTDAKVFYFEGDTYMEYLIAAGGKANQAGFATSEP